MLLTCTHAPATSPACDIPLACHSYGWLGTDSNAWQGHRIDMSVKVIEWHEDPSAISRALASIAPHHASWCTSTTDTLPGKDAGGVSWRAVAWSGCAWCTPPFISCHGISFSHDMTCHDMT